MSDQDTGPQTDRTGGTDPGPVAPSLDRRSMLTALGAAATAGALSRAPLDAFGADTAAAMELSAPELPTWRQTERHEAARTPVDNPQDGANVLGRKLLAVNRGLSQINMKLWEDDDAVRAECGDAVGHQHRFLASTIVFAADKAHLSYHHDRYDDSGGFPIRNPPARGRLDHGRMETRARIAEGAPNADACGPVTFRVNNVYWNRLPLPEMAVRDGDGGAETLYGDYDRGDLRADVDAFQRDRGTQSPYVPDDDSGLSAVADDGLDLFTSPEAGLGIDLGTEALDALSGYHEVFEAGSRYGGKLSTLATVAGIATDTVAFLSALDGLDDYEGVVRWGDDDVYVASGGAGGGAVDVQFVDFTVTVPPGATAPDGTTVEVVQNFDLDPEPGDDFNYFDGHRPDEFLRTEHAWTLDIPGYDAEDFDGIDASRLPTASVDGVDYGAHSPPDPSIELRRSGTTETDPITFVADAPDATADATYRWRIYKNGGKLRPATLFGETVALDDQLLRRSPEPTLTAFGPGEYVAELTVRDRYGKTATAAERFSVDPAPTPGTEAAVADTLLRVTRGDSVELSAEGSVGHDGTADSIDLIEWEIQYPSAVTGGVVAHDAENVAGRDAGVDAPPFKPPRTDPTRPVVEHTFEHVGIYRAAVRVYALEDEGVDPSNVQPVYYAEGDERMADKRDVTVVVTPEGSGDDPDAGRARGGGRR